MANRLKTIAKVVFTICLFGFLIEVIGSAHILSALTDARWTWLIGGYIAFLGVRLLEATQMKVLLFKVGLNVTVTKVFFANALSALYAFVLPGDLVASLAKWKALSSATGQKTTVLNAIVYNRLALLLPVLALAVIAPLDAAEKKKKARRQTDPAAQILRRLEKAELNEEQVAKIKELAAKFAPKLAEAQKKLGLTREQRKARREAGKKNKAESIKGKKARNAVNAAMNLSEEQKKAMVELRKLQSEFSKSAFALLSDEQRAKAGIKGGGKKKRKRKRSE